MNTNSLLYNLPAALALIKFSETLSIPVLHQSFDYFWEHAERNRSMFSKIVEDESMRDLLTVVSNWESNNWIFATPTKAFRSRCIYEGVNAMSVFTVTTPVLQMNLPVAGSVDEELSFITVSSSKEFKFGRAMTFRFGRDINEDSQTVKFIIPSKIARSKGVYEAIENISKYAESINMPCNLEILVTGAVYDMETTSGLLELEGKFRRQMFGLQAAFENKDVSLKIYFLNGIPRFNSAGRLSIEEYFRYCDVAVFGSSLETDCLGLYEACISNCLVWMNAWSESHREIYKELVADLIVGQFSGDIDTLINPFDISLAKVIMRHNERITRSKRSVIAFKKCVGELVWPGNRASNYPVGIKTVANNVLLKVKNSLEPIVVCIDGYPGSGKSTFAHELRANLESNGVRVTVISMDDFVDESKASVSGPQLPINIRVQRLLEYISSGIAYKPMIIPKYNHGSAQRTRRLANTFDLLVLEGLYSLRAEGRGADGGEYSDIRLLSSYDIWMNRDECKRQSSLLHSDLEKQRSTERIVRRMNYRQVECINSIINKELANIIVDDNKKESE